MCVGVCVCVCVYVCAHRRVILHLLQSPLRENVTWILMGLIETCFILHLLHSSTEDYQWRGEDEDEGEGPGGG